jgi:hypothetical protein
MHSDNPWLCADRTTTFFDLSLRQERNWLSLATPLSLSWVAPLERDAGRNRGRFFATFFQP